MDRESNKIYKDTKLGGTLYGDEWFFVGERVAVRPITGVRFSVRPKRDRVYIARVVTDAFPPNGTWHDKGLSVSYEEPTSDEVIADNLPRKIFPRDYSVTRIDGDELGEGFEEVLQREFEALLERVNSGREVLAKGIHALQTFGELNRFLSQTITEENKRASILATIRRLSELLERNYDLRD